MTKLTVDQLVKLPNSQKITILVIFIIVVVGAYVFYIFMPQQDTIKANQEAILKLQSQYNEQQNILSNLPRFKQELKIMQTEFDESLKMLPNAREIPSLLTNISTLAQESGLEINLFQPKNEVPMDFYAQIPVDMKVTGKYHQMGVFFDKLSQLPRIINVTDITMKLKSSSSKDGNSNILIDASFSATTFKFIEKPADGKPNAVKKKK